ncbi:hypothetical protein, partial [Chryseobacterium artocarpi]|uniref:hypothetical protein n=1 Tax=Chryseobacterium artocarpi TaxID=1414727 RepID=UPI001041D50F
MLSLLGYICSYGQLTSNVTAPNYSGLTVLNSTGGTTLTNGVKLQVTGGGNIQIIANNKAQIYQNIYSNSATAFAQQTNNGTNGFMISIGNNVYHSGNSRPTGYAATQLSTTNILSHTTNTVGVLQSVTIAYKITQNSKDYLFNITYKYDPGNKDRIFMDVEATLPANAEVVKYLIVLDAMLGGVDRGYTMKTGTDTGPNPDIKMGTYNDTGYEFFEYKSGRMWSGYYAGSRLQVGSNNSFNNTMTYDNTISNTYTDTAIGISYNFGSTAGTYTGSSAIMFQCAAPRVAPTYSSTSKTINCTAGGADIASGFTGTAGAGYVVRYLDANYNPIGDRTGTTHAPLNVGAAGTYYAAYYDAANECMSPLTTITVTGTSCSSDVQITADNTNPTCAVKGTNFTIKYK